MMQLVIPVALLLLVSWLLVRGTRGVWQKLAIVVAVPVGALLGGYSGSGICYMILRLQGRGESHDDIIPVAALGMLGLLVGGIVLPLIVRRFAKKHKRDDNVA